MFKMVIFRHKVVIILGQLDQSLGQSLKNVHLCVTFNYDASVFSISVNYFYSFYAGLGFSIINVYSILFFSLSSYPYNSYNNPY